MRSVWSDMKKDTRIRDVVSMYYRYMFGFLMLPTLALWFAVYSIAVKMFKTHTVTLMAAIVVCLLIGMSIYSRMSSVWNGV